MNTTQGIKKKVCTFVCMMSHAHNVRTTTYISLHRAYDWCLPIGFNLRCHDWDFLRLLYYPLMANTYMPHLLLKACVCNKRSTCQWRLLASSLSVHMNPMHHSHLCLCLSECNAYHSVCIHKCVLCTSSTGNERWQISSYH